jgi:hypothetical protein
VSLLTHPALTLCLPHPALGGAHCSARPGLLGVVLLWLGLWTGWRQGWAPVSPAQGAKVVTVGDWEPLICDTGETGLSTSGQ